MKNDYDTDLDVMFCWSYGFINDPVCSMESDGKKELKKSDNEKNVMTTEQKKIYEKIKLTYKEEEQKKLRKN